MKERRKIHKVLMGIAVISYVAAIACAMTAAFISDGTATSPAVANMMTSVVVFAAAGIVLHVISSTNLPSLKIERERT